MYNSIFGDVSEKAFNHIQPCGAGRCEMKMKTLIPFLPLLHGRVCVRGVIVADQVDFLCFWRRSLYQIQKTDLLLMPMSFHTGPDYAPICYGEGGKERSCSIAFVVVGHRPASPFF